jgi:hypothetical protein
MRGKVAKRIRKQAYGDLSLREPIQYISIVSSSRRDFKGILHQTHIIRVPEDHPRRKYQELKREYKS